MGLLYLNIVNSLLLNHDSYNHNKYNESLIFSIIHKNYDSLYYISLTDLFNYLHLTNIITSTQIDHSISFINSKTDYLNEFIVMVGKISHTIKTSSLIETASHIIDFVDNADFPINNTYRMHHTPFIIYNNCNIKLPENGDDSLKFNIHYSSTHTIYYEYKLATEIEDLKKLHHAKYNLVTEPIYSLTKINLDRQGIISAFTFKHNERDINIFMKLIGKNTKPKQPKKTSKIHKRY